MAFSFFLFPKTEMKEYLLREIKLKTKPPLPLIKFAKHAGPLNILPPSPFFHPSVIMCFDVEC